MSSLVCSCVQVIKDQMYPSATEGLIFDDEGCDRFERSA